VVTRSRHGVAGFEHLSTRARPSQLIASVRQTIRGMRPGRTIAAATLLVFGSGPSYATECASPTVKMATLRGQVFYLGNGQAGQAAAGIQMKLLRWAASDVKVVLTDRADQEGRFTFPRLAPGLYGLSFGETGQFGHVLVQLDRRSRNGWLRVDVGELGDRLCSPTQASARAVE